MSSFRPVPEAEPVAPHGRRSDSDQGVGSPRWDGGGRPPSLGYEDSFLSFTAPPTWTECSTIAFRAPKTSSETPNVIMTREPTPRCNLTQFLLSALIELQQTVSEFVLIDTG